MENNLVIAALFAAVLITSGCVNEAVDDRTPEEGFQEFEEPSAQESEESSTEESRESEESGEAASSQEIDRTIEVTAFGDNSFDVENIEVEQGQTVEFVLVNEGGRHDLVIPSLNKGTEIISGGETDSFTYAFDETGEFEFECSVGTHVQQGMLGTITVT